MQRVVLYLMLMMLVAGCQPAQRSPQSSTLRIAALLKTSTNPYFQLMWEGIKQEADLHRVVIDLFWPASEDDFQYQYDFLQHRARQYDALLLSPSNVSGVAPYLPPLKRAGKIIVVLDAEVELPGGQDARTYYDAFLGTDNELGGIMVAKYAAPRLPVGGTVIILGGFPQYMQTPGRVAAFRAALRAYDPTVKIAEFIARYDRTTARDVAATHWAAFAESDLIFCANDHMALGVLDLFRQRRLTPLPLVTGYDSIREAQEVIATGEMLTSVIQFPARMGREGVKTLLTLVQGRPAEPRMLIDPELSVRRVTIESVRVEDVYTQRN